MAFTSEIRRGEIIIDDTNAAAFACDFVDQAGELKTRGRLERDWEKEPFASTPHTSAFDLPLIPRSEWTARIEEMERTKTRLSDLCDAAGLPCLDQNGTNYCWINGPVYCLEAIRVAQGEPLVLLSPASAGAPIKNFRNVGGWGTEGLAWLVENGCCPVENWPANAIDRRYYTDENREIAKKYRVTEWWELRPRNLDQLMTCLLHRIPVAVGYNWWSHEVSAIDPVVVGPNDYGIRIRNSWGMSWGDRGYSILKGSKALPDDAVAPRAAIPV